MIPLHIKNALASKVIFVENYALNIIGHLLPYQTKQQRKKFTEYIKKLLRPSKIFHILGLYPYLSNAI